MPASDPARAAAALLLNQLERHDRSLDKLLPDLDAKLSDGRDIRFARQLALGAVRWQKRLDWMLDPLCSRPVAELSPWARHILRLGAYQLCWLDSVPDRATVHTSVELAKRFAHKGIAGLVNAVLRRLSREREHIAYPDSAQEPVRYLSVYYSHPEWLVTRWLERWDAEFVTPLLVQNNQGADLNIRLNPLRGAAELPPDIEAVGPLPGFFKVPNPAGLFATAAYRGGHFQVQDPNAALAVALLDPQPGERLLDLCSAPGGKATQSAAAMADRGLVVATDISPARIGRVRDNARRLGLSALHPVVRDGTTPGAGAFDRVLADVPCSATGVLGRRPDVRWRRAPGQLPGLVARQHKLLRRAFEHLRPGGVLVYSTCSLESDENEVIVDGFLERTPAARLEPAADAFPNRSWAGRFVQTIPGHHPGDGSFAARIRKAQ